MSSTIAASVVTWNSEGTVGDCLDSLFKQTRRLDSIFVYDNASADGTRSILDRYASKVNVVCASENSGFCGGHNAIIEQSHSDFLLLVNPDVRLDPGYVAKAVSVMESNNEVGTVCGLLLQEDRPDSQALIDGTGLIFTRSRRFLLRDHRRRSLECNRKADEVFGSDGALPLFRRAMIEDVSVDGYFFDPEFFAHKEDHDVAWRSRLLGWKTLFEPACVAYHPRVFRPGDLAVRKRLSSEIKVHAVKNDLLMLLKNEQAGNFVRDFLHIVPRRLAIAMYSLFAERSSLAAYGYVARRLRDIMRQRRQIQRRTSSSSKEIRRWIFSAR